MQALPDTPDTLDALPGAQLPSFSELNALPAFSSPPTFSELTAGAVSWIPTGMASEAYVPLPPGLSSMGLSLGGLSLGGLSLGGLTLDSEEVNSPPTDALLSVPEGEVMAEMA
jgi:hypothetical protein